MRVPLAQVRSPDADLRRRGGVLAALLVIMAAGICLLSAYNLYMGELRYVLINVAFLAVIATLFTVNYLGRVRLAAIFTVFLTVGGALSLTNEDLGATYIAMTVPIFISSYLLVPWAGLVAAAAIGVLAELLVGISPLSLAILCVVAVAFYVFANSLERAYRQSYHQAQHDALTGLPNRDVLNEHLGSALSNVRRSRGQIAILFMDLDNFKLINDSLGHDYGDRLLQDVAERLERCLGPEDMAARLGGDEFIILLRDIGDPADAVVAAERVAEELKVPFDLFGQKVTITTCIGIATYGHPSTGFPAASVLEAHTEQPHNLLRNADLALYQAKSRKDSYEVFTPDMHSVTVGRLELERELRGAIEKNEFEVYYQPKFYLADRRLAGAEALVRWGNVQRGLVMPSEFIPIAEETGLIVPIGEQVMEVVFYHASHWYTGYESSRGLTFCLNLSARQFSDPELIPTISRLIESYALPPANLQLEITESMLMENREMTIERLRALKAMGLKLAIDDFGKEYSSLMYLKDLPVDTLKVDQAFIAGLAHGATDVAIVRLVIELAHELGLDVVAEGVQTEEQLTRLTELGCDLAQGFYFSKALPGCQLEALLGKRSAS